MKSLSRRWCHGAPLWLLLLALFPSTVHCQTSNEKFILSRFYDVAGGPNWINNTGWKNANVPICSWFGILCLGKPSDTHGVSGINLPGNNLQGRIAKLIYTLPQLRTVNVQKNPGITNAGFDGFETKHPQNFLQKLLFAQCSLTALTGLENAPSSLTELHLTGNQLKSNFPTEILNVTSLQILYLSYNKIKGTLPTQIGGLTNLQELFLYQTAMTGQLPTQLGKLNKLTIFTVAENLLSGTLPTELNQMSSMKTLSFHNNGVNVGSIGGPLIDFSGLPMLSELYLDGNDLTGTIPSTFLKNNVNTDTRVAVGLSNNKLTGALPLTLNRFQLLDIDLVGNSISLIPVSFCNNKGWMSGLVELFGCNAIMCEVGTYNDFGVQLSAESPCLICNQPATDFWGSTSCGVTSNNSTAAPSSSGSSSSSSLSSLDVRTILGTFYQDLTGTLWLNQTGWDQIGTLLKTFQVSDLARVSNFTAASVCSWLGVTCDTSNNVIEISLPRNGLVGTIPTEIGDLTKLQLLNVAGNQAVTIKKKEFWTAIGSTNIKTLNLADTNINNLVGIGAVTQLQALTLDGVYFAGTLPTDLFQLMNLKSLHMQYNVLTGTLPTLIGQLSKLQVLNLYDNELKGSLPSQLGFLTKLTILDLSENQFNGTLPTQLQALTTLSQLHLHQTFGAFAGPLPAFSNFPFLSELTLDSNFFTGTVPPTFLQGVTNKSQSMYVGLSFNRLTGSIPSQLANFSDMELLIEGNTFKSIAVELCSKKLWMDGEVGRVGGCSAIGCPVGTWNIYGKASAYLNASCDGCAPNPYVGQTFCTDNQTAVNEEKTYLGELEILNQLYEQTNGPNWTLPDNNWATVGVPLCEREGVVCDNSDPKNNSGVIELDLFSFGLRGIVPSDIFTLPKLRKLRLNNNSIEVDFHGIGNATKLVVLQLASTNLHKLDGLGDASSSLSELHLAFNELTGSFPSELLVLGSLKKLFLQQNQFSGNLPPEVDQLQQLQELWLQGNILSGQLPAELGNITTLQVLTMGENYLSGTIPPEISKLSSLVHLDLQSQLSQSKLVGSLPAFDSLSQLTYLKLSDNNIAGTVPTTFIASSNKTTLITVDLSQNMLTGPIPTSLGAFQNLFIDLTGNNITVLPQTFCNNSKWMDGMVSQFQCDAILCPPGTYSALGRQTPAGGSCKTCPTYNSTFYGQNECLTFDETNEREILQLFFVGLNGSNWVDNTNWLSEKSVCTWYGIGCNATGSVVSIVLDTNNLEDIHEGIDGFFHDTSSIVLTLPDLQVLDLRGNGVRLDLTHIPANSSSLQNLTLSSTNLASLNGIGGAKKLQELHVTDNGLKGTIPSELFWLTNLRRLYMSFNAFSGTLSGKLLANLTNLEDFYMFGNNITGTIPSEVGKLQALREFIMPANNLNGTVPSQFSSLSRLEQLSLYDQQGAVVLSGPIPTFANSPRLWYFDVSNNALTGSIPDSFLVNSVFRNSTLSIYLSNNEITGTIPSSLSQFSTLDIRLDGNRIASIPAQLCALPQWMNGEVSRVGCDAILCHKGSYNSLGRQDSANNTCQPCQSGSPYLGQNNCVDLQSEKSVLIYLYENTGGGTSWTRQSKWNSNDPICSWEGVLCKDGHTTDNQGVTGLFLANNNLQGTLPPVVWSLPLLQSMNLQSNQDLRVTMDGFSNATGLEVLILNSVKLDTIAGVSSATKLRELHITDCALTGTFPDEIFSMGASLQNLYIAYNSFYGTISTKIGQLAGLTELFAFDNDFSGSIPTEIGKMTSLVDLVLAENLLSGSLPTELSSLPNIQVISLYRRAKPGPKLSGNLTAFNNAPKLTDLYLDHNEIEGTIPPNFLTSSTSAQNIILSFNELTGTIPVQIGFFPALEIELEGNEISGFDKSFCNKKDWMDGQVADFQCDAILCPPQHASFPYGRAVVDGNNSTGNVTCTKCPFARSAPYYGSTSCLIPANVRLVLVGLYNSCNGKNWIYQHFWGSTTVNYCNWDGIGCNGGDIISIDLSANNLTGTIPDTLFQISTLEYLWLNSNPISFNFPSSNQTLTTNLQELRLDNTGLTSLKGISALTSLVTLHVEHNLIQGQLDYELLELANLRALYMGDNGVTGTFPGDIEQLKYLNTLSLRDNGIEGGLPSFENVRALTKVDLANNKFTGAIPSLFFYSLSSYAPLMVDLSSNTLSGTIPSSLGRFQNLTIYLRGNLFDGLPSQLCENTKWNDGDVGLFGCDAIMCPPKTYSPLGRAHQNTRCVDCASVSSYGQSTCASAAPAGLRVQRWALGSFLSIVMMAAMGRIW